MTVRECAPGRARVDEHVGPCRWRTGGDQSKAPSLRTRTTHGLDNFNFCQGPAAVDVDEVEGLAGGVEELVAEFFDFLGRPRGLELALGRAVRELVRERGLDGLLPARNVDR